MLQLLLLLLLPLLLLLLLLLHCRYRGQHLLFTPFLWHFRRLAVWCFACLNSRGTRIAGAASKIVGAFGVGFGWLRNLGGRRECCFWVFTSTTAAGVAAATAAGVAAAAAAGVVALWLAWA